MARIGIGVEGSNGRIETTNANEDILAEVNNSYYKFKLSVTNETNVLINGQFRVFLESGEEFIVEKDDLDIKSVVIEAHPVRYVWKGFYY
ncbi:hypothetical protein NL868_001306 [Shigella flexneri]|nr:hypothetical protein [Shigella flexneri]